MDEYRLKALDKAIEAGGGYDPDGVVVVRKAKTIEAYLRGDDKAAAEPSPTASPTEKVEMLCDAHPDKKVITPDALKDYIARLNTGAAKPSVAQEEI